MKAGVAEMTEERKAYLRAMEAEGEVHGWVALPSLDSSDYLAHFRDVCGRYNINPSKATRLEYEFVTRITDSEFYSAK